VFPPKEEAIAARLIEMQEDNEDTVKKRMEVWNQLVPNIEEAFKNMLLNVQSDRPVEQVTEVICDAI